VAEAGEGAAGAHDSAGERGGHGRVTLRVLRDGRVVRRQRSVVRAQQRGVGVAREQTERRTVQRPRRHLDFLDFRLLQPLGFGATVLEPDLHLRLRQVQRTGELGALGDRQVLLLAELLLQRHQLLRGEGRARLPVRLVLAQVALQFWHFPV